MCVSCRDYWFAVWYPIQGSGNTCFNNPNTPCCLHGCIHLHTPKQIYTIVEGEMPSNKFYQEEMTNVRARLLACQMPLVVKVPPKKIYSRRFCRVLFNDADGVLYQRAPLPLSCLSLPSLYLPSMPQRPSKPTQTPKQSLSPKFPKLMAHECVFFALNRNETPIGDHDDNSSF